MRKTTAVTAVVGWLLLVAGCTPRASSTGAGAGEREITGRAPRNAMFQREPARRIVGVAGAVDSFGVSLDTLTGATVDSFLLDGLGQVYAWTPEGTLVKFVTASDVLAGGSTELRYQNPRLGRLASVDLTNPLRPVLFYDDTQTVVWLDRNLTELRQLSLVELDLGQVDAVAYARADGLWLYAPDRQELILLDRQNAIAQGSPNLSQVFGRPIRAAELAATAQQVTMATRDGRLLRFGPFGAYRTQLLRPGRHLVVDGERLLFAEAGRWYASYADGGPPGVVDTGSDGLRLVMLREGRTLWRRGGRLWVE